MTFNRFGLTAIGLALAFNVAFSSGQAIDPNAISLLRQVRAKLQSVKTLSATEDDFFHSGKTGVTQEEWMEVRLMRPNLAYVGTALSMHAKGGPHIYSGHWMTCASDSKTLWRVFNTANSAEKWPCDAGDVEMVLKNSEPLKGFFDAGSSALATVQEYANLGLLRSLSVSKADAAGERRVRVSFQKPGAKPIRTCVYTVTPALLIRRIDISDSDGSHSSQDELLDLRVNRPMSAASFAYKPPAGVNLKPAVFAPMKPAFANGTTAPDFSVRGRGGKTVRLSDFRGKVVVLDFWASWCGNCTLELPVVDDLARRYAGQGVVAFAVDGADTLKGFKYWLGKNPGLKSLVFAIDPADMNGTGAYGKLYKTGLPSTLVLDREGRVMATFDGFEFGSTKRNLEKAVKSALVG